MRSVVYYSGWLDQGEAHVRRDGRPFDPYPAYQVFPDLTPLPFAWGCQSSRAGWLAVALILDVTGSKRLAQRHWLDLVLDLVQVWPAGETWQVSSESVRTWLRQRFGYADGEIPSPLPGGVYSAGQG